VEVPIIALTANAIVGASEEYLSYGFKDYLSKPIDILQLEEMLVRYLPEGLVKEKVAKPQEPKKEVKPEEKSKAADAEKTGEAEEAAKDGAGSGVTAAGDAAGTEDSRTENTGTENAGDAGASDAGGDGAGAAEEDGGTFVDRLAKAGFNIEEAHSFTMDDDEFYLELLETYINGIQEKEDGIRKCYAEKDWKNYQVLVHGLKSSSRTIGADHLADLALAQEMASKEQDVEKIDAGVEELLTTYHEITEVIRGAIGK
jgi:HPt (histidine-containing phosphotransfer) domain-containing protein